MVPWVNGTAKTARTRITQLTRRSVFRRDGVIGLRNLAKNVVLVGIRIALPNSKSSVLIEQHHQRAKAVWMK
jgi:hypothetical protein